MGAPATSTPRQLAHYFEYSDVGIEVLEDGLVEVPFGEYLVERKALSRQQLFEALMAQDHHPGVPIGEVAASLGFIPYQQVDALLADYNALEVVEASLTTPINRQDAGGARTDARTRNKMVRIRNQEKSRVVFV